MPTAVMDSAALGLNNYALTQLGNVLTNDTRGADDITIVGVVAGDTGAAAENGLAGTAIQGTYGKLTIAADGTYSYQRDPETDGGVSDEFTYTIKDGDGDLAFAKVTITIGDSDVTLDLPVLGEAGTLVNEAGLPVRGSEPAGSNEAANSETTAGTITYTSPDTPAVVTIGGVAVTFVGQTFAGTSGTLTITSIAVGSIGYSYTLTDNTLAATSNDTFAVVVTDADGDFQSGNLVVEIVDDMPVVGDFVDFSVANAVGVTAGATNAGFISGADDWCDISITGEAIAGLTYLPLDVITDSNGNVESVTLTAEETGSGDDVFSFTVMADGQQSFNLIKPEAETETPPLSLANLSAGGPIPFLELADFSIEFSGTGSGVNTSAQGMGVDNQFIDFGETLTIELYNPGLAGDDTPDNNPANAKERLVDSLRFTETGGGGPLSWKVYNTVDGTMESGLVPDSSGVFTINPSIDFNKIEITGELDAKARLTSLVMTEKILPDGEIITFNVVGTDGDGDTTSDDDVTVTILPGASSATLAQDAIVQTAEEEASTLLATENADMLVATDEADVFVWSLADNTVEGDQIVGFHPDADSINIADILGDSVDTTDFSSYLDVRLEGDSTVIKVSSSGDFDHAEQVITVQDVNLFEGIDFSDSDALSTALQNMVDAGKLITD